MVTEERTYVIRFGAPSPRRPRRPQRRMWVARTGRHRTAGKHRIGNPGLRHCREMPAVRRRLPARQRPSTTPGVLAAVLVILAGATALSAWLAGAGAAAFADMIRR